MLYSRESFAVIHGVSKDECRPQLNGVCLRPDGSTIATDGHVLFEVSANGNHSDEFPALTQKGLKATKPDNQIIGSGTISAVLKAMPKVKHLPILSNAELLKQGKKAMVFRTTDLETESITKFKPLEGPYPNTDAVYPVSRRQPYTHPCRPTEYEIKLGVSILQQLCNFVHAASTCGRKELETITFKFTGPTTAAIFDAGENDNGQRISGLLMPRRK
jgi:hypothetical protein